MELSLDELAVGNQVVEIKVVPGFLDRRRLQFLSPLIVGPPRYEIVIPNIRVLARCNEDGLRYDQHWQTTNHPMGGRQDIKREARLVKFGRRNPAPIQTFGYVRVQLSPGRGWIEASGVQLNGIP